MQISPHVHAVKIPFTIPVGPDKKLDRFVYSYVVSGSRKNVLVDSGVAGSNAIVKEYLSSLGLNLSDISILLLTHSHPDHIGGAVAIKEKSSCRIMAHPAAREWVEDVERQFQERPVPGFHSLVEGSVKIDEQVQDGDRLDLGDIILDVLHTPGHSRCSISIFFPEEGILWAGDAIPQQGDLPIYEDVVGAVQSIRRLQKVEGIKQLLASWSDPQPGSDPYQLMDDGLQYFQRIHDLIRQLPAREIMGDPMGLCRKMVEKLGLPEIAVNPLIARSFSSHIALLVQEEL